MPVVISQHLLNVFVQLANKRGLKKKANLIRQYLLYKIAIFNASSAILMSNLIKIFYIT
jgi:hypothetical protein